MLQLASSCVLLHQRRALTRLPTCSSRHTRSGVSGEGFPFFFRTRQQRILAHRHGLLILLEQTPIMLQVHGNVGIGATSLVFYLLHHLPLCASRDYETCIHAERGQKELLLEESCGNISWRTTKLLQLCYFSLYVCVCVCVCERERVEKQAISCAMDDLSSLDDSCSSSPDFAAFHSGPWKWSHLARSLCGSAHTPEQADVACRHRCRRDARCASCK